MHDTIDQLVRARATALGSKEMVIDPTCRMSYAELDASTRELAAALVHAGVGKATRVGLIMPNGARWVQVAVAVTRIGAVLVPLSTLLQAPELVTQYTDTGETTPNGAVGMIQIRGPHIMRGMCRRSREELFTPDGYYPTGDLGHLDDDGFMFYHGRSDDVFKVSGATVYPSEVEQALRTIDAVENAFVTDVSGAVGAVVITDATVDEVRTAARKRLSSFKVPTVWLVVKSDDNIPRGTTGKVDVRRLRTLLAEQS
jgi:acyl-CoA synthetase (AMP-forming)/AMP-acid ligase II